MFNQLTPGNLSERPPTQAPQRTIYVATPADKNNIIEAVPLYTTDEPTYQVYRPTPVPPSRTSRPGAPHAVYGITSQPLSGLDMSAASPRVLARDEDAAEDQGIKIESTGKDRIRLIIYGHKLFVMLVILCFILIGFSLDKVPDYLPKLLDIIP